ncbi:MAG: hypothetical protein A2Y09_05285 [Planctomycetes bacterium GWA2_39_15]|nr:MAG: hypothetical protein A2Y09_05285 [Planctomycetes bacterium GWA2_39_15]
MPVYNGEKYIREAVDSLLAQTFTDLELIISDNASTDGTEAICREYAARDTRIRYIRQRENRGVVANFQFVLAKAIGEYFMWAAADDVWDIIYIETLLSISSAYQCVAYCSLQAIDANGKKIMHPANNQKFEFTGSRFARRLKYYIQPNFMGKSGSIYGIFPVCRLRKIDFQTIEHDDGEDICIYVLLEHTEIRHVGSGFFYKRLHNDCHGGFAMQEMGNPDIFERLLFFARRILLDSKLFRYIRRSSAIESVFLLAAYPITVAYNLAYTVFFKIRSILTP